MTAPPDRDELRLQADLRARIDGTRPSRQRDWFDDLCDEPVTPAEPDPVPPARRPVTERVTERVTEEPRWDWRRLLHWPHLGIKTRLCCALAAVVAPVTPDGYSTSTIWAYTVSQARDQWGIGYGYAIGGAALALAINAAAHRGRRAGLLRLTLLAIAVIGFIGAMNWSDPIDLVTGESR